MIKFVSKHYQVIDVIVTITAMILLILFEHLQAGRTAATVVLVLVYGMWNFAVGNIRAHATFDEQMDMALGSARKLAEDMREAARRMKEVNHG